MRDVVIYGAGQMGAAIGDIVVNSGRKILCYIDMTRRDPLNQYQCIGPCELPEQRREECDVVVAMVAASFVSVSKYLKSVGYLNVFSPHRFISSIYPDLEFANLWMMSETTYKTCMSYENAFRDQKSKSHWRCALEWFYSEYDDISDISRNKYFPKWLIPSLQNADEYVDIALLDGSYANKWIELKGREAHISSFVHRPSTIPKEKIVEMFSEYRNVNIYDYGINAGENVDTSKRIGLMKPYEGINRSACYENGYSLDSFWYDCGVKADYLRLYSFDRIWELVMAGRGLITNCRPIISANIGHYEEDMLKVLPLLQEMCIHYLFRFEMHSYQGNDCILYAIPEEKFIVSDVG